MHFEDLADNGELSIISSFEDHYSPAKNIKQHFTTSLPSPLIPNPWVFERAKKWGLLNY